MMDAHNPSIDRRTLLKYTGAAGLVTGIAGCLGGGDDTDEVVITLSEFPDTVDPIDHITGDYFDVFDHIYEPLFDIEPGETPEPRVVEDWEHTGDGAVDLLLREDVQFHDGQDLTAEDVAFTLRRQIDPEFGTASSQVAGLASIDGAEVIDDHTVRFEYSGASTLAEYEFGNYARTMNAEWAREQGAETEKITGDSAEVFNGTGPYEVVEFTPNTEIVLEAFDDYWGEEPPFDRLVFNADNESSGRVSALETGETDLTLNVLPEDVGTVRENPDTEIRRVTSFRNIFCPMKNESEPFDSQAFRQAMNYAVDNEGIINDTLSSFGAPMSQPTPDGVNGYNPDLDPYPYDPEQAERLVDESGYAGVEIELVAPQGRYLNDADVAQTVADQIDQLENVDCGSRIVDFGVVSDANSAGMDDYDIPFFLIGWSVITGDADYGLAGFFQEEGGVQTFRDEELDSAIEESQGIEDPEEREQALQDINEMAREKAPWIFLHLQESIYGVQEEIQWEPRKDESIWAWEMSR
ncbi:ABC transporter substrate-binding protein [Halopiger djelfimassiliensis]|uniref:ABC transporter substrate-binding protein n=1 Tax=Halopiger djelfimassiliensis TaxID=1293047 RepID=UPI0006781C0D|nr:ABC transporter substrate-binding protein [Halopiger djelfimassiliensis]